MTRVACYARFSTDKQSESSIKDQISACTEYALRQGWEITAHFEDQGISGVALGNRPGALKLQSAAMVRAFDVLLVTDLTRLSRSQGDLSKMIDRFVAKELRIIGVQDGYDSGRRGHKLQAGLSGIIGESFREMISDRTALSLRERAKAGYHTGGASYGYKSEPVDPANPSGYHRLVADEPAASVVRRIFELYSDGVSPRGIAAQLNAEGVPSPGARWKRTKRRTDGKWLASAIHGDVKRGSGMLNNELYIGKVVYGRRKLRKDPDSGVRIPGAPEQEVIERQDERLRILSDDLWQRAKARQALQSRVRGGKVKAGLRRRRPGGGRPGKYPLSGLLKCAACEASFALSNGTRYQCSSHHEGGPAACSVSLSVPRTRVEGVVIDCVENVLLDTARLLDVEQRYRASVATGIVVDHGPRIAELASEIRNISDAIAKGLMSDALAGRLQAAEAERGRLLAARIKPFPAPPMLSAEGVERRRADVLGKIAQGGDIARSILTEIFPSAIQLEPDESGRYLWAVFVDDFDATRISLLYGSRDERLAAQAAEVLAAFDANAAHSRVGNNGSGGALWSQESQIFVLRRAA